MRGTFLSKSISNKNFTLILRFKCLIGNLFLFTLISYDLNLDLNKINLKRFLINPMKDKRLLTDKR